MHGVELLETPEAFRSSFRESGIHLLRRKVDLDSRFRGNDAMKTFGPNRGWIPGTLHFRS